MAVAPSSSTRSDRVDSYPPGTGPVALGTRGPWRPRDPSGIRQRRAPSSASRIRPILSTIWSGHPPRDVPLCAVRDAEWRWWYAWVRALGAATSTQSGLLTALSKWLHC